MKCLVIYSPFAKKGKIKKYINLIYEKLSKVYCEVDFCETKYSKHAQQIAKENAQSYNLIVIASGDGVISEVVNGIMATKFRPNLAILPLGTSNDTANSLNIPKNIRKTLKIILEGKTFACDIVKFNNHYFVYELSIGQGTKCSYTAKQTTKMKIGWFAYLLEVFKDIFTNHYNLADFVFNDEIKISCHYAMFVILNSKYIAKLKVNKNALLNDQNVCCIIFKRKNNGFASGFFATFNLFKFLLFGVKAITKNNNCAVIKTVNSFKIKNLSHSFVNADGEFCANPATLDGEVISKAINFIVKK